MAQEAPRLELRGIGKSFPGVRALSDMNLTFRKGAVHVICGENGAGKSTLLKTINGIIQPDEGEIRFNGEPVVIGSPARARELGISMISQELNYIPEFTVMEMMFLGLEPVNRYGKIDWKEIRSRTVDVLKREKLAYDPDTKLKDLSISDIQMLEIMKAVSQESNVIIMDEPTSAITDREVDILFEKVNELRAKGAAIIYVSHRLDELFRIADDLSVIRDGRHVETRAAKDFDIATVIQLMVGRAIDNVFPPRHEPKPGETKLEVRGLSDGSKYQDVSFTVRAGEVVGFSGLMGAGRTEVARAVFGLDSYVAGEVLVGGKPAKIDTVQDGIAAGMAMLSEDRKRYGIVPVRSIRENVGLSNLKLFINGGFLHKGREKELVAKNCGRMRVKAPDYEVTLDALSGGNQQKVVLAKWMLLDPDILILDEPTRGVDVGAKYEIYKMIFELAEEGKAILVISSELPELLGICDRIYVMAKGQVTGELANHEFDSEKIMRFATIGGGTLDVEPVMASPGQQQIHSTHDLGV